jgi:hypothetical protein
MRRVVAPIGFCALACVTVPIAKPKLPPTPMRVAFARVDAQWKSHENKMPPLYLADLVAWFDGWHGLTVVAHEAIDALPARSTEITPITFDAAPLRALCEATRGNVDAIVFTRFDYWSGPRSVCSKPTGRFSTRYDPGEGGCAEYKTSGSDWRAKLWFRVLYPARCVFGPEDDVARNQELRSWDDHKTAARLELPDLLHEMKGEYEVGERLVVCGPDNAACATPTQVP